MTKMIGLTGGIGSGKSLVANTFEALGVPIIDTDQIAREIVNPGKPALTQIIEKFGNDILLENGHLNRAKLRKQIFKHPDDKLWLEALLHPLIREETTRKAKAVNTPYCIIVIPLLFESQFNYPLDHIIVVDATTQDQLHRVMKRDNISQSEALSIIQSQASREDRLKGADTVIENTGTPEAITERVYALHSHWQGE